MPDHVDGRSLANVVGTGFECETEHGDATFFQLAVERALDLGDEPASCLLVHLDGRTEQMEALTVIARGLVEGTNILGKARATETEARPEKRATNALVGADAIRDGAHISARELAELRDLV